jgi:ATP-dependent RNA helicase DDX42
LHYTPLHHTRALPAFAAAHRQHTLRVGRTGRAGDKEGVAISLLLDGRDARFAGLLVSSLTLGGQDVPPALHALAMKVSRGRGA